MANKTISKALLGLMTVALVMTAMIPVSLAGFGGNPATGDGIVVSTTTNAPDATFTVGFVQDFDPEETFDVTVELTAGGNSIDKEVTVIVGDDYTSTRFLVSDILGENVAADTYSIDITVANSATGDGVYTKDLVVNEYIPPWEGIDSTVIYKDEINNKDDLHPGDNVELELELRADKGIDGDGIGENDNVYSYEDLWVRGQLSNGHGKVFGDWQRITGLTLVEGNDEETITMNFQLPETIEKAYAEDYIITLEFGASTSYNSDRIQGRFTTTIALDKIELQDDGLVFDDVDLTVADGWVTAQGTLRNNGNDKQTGIDIVLEIDGAKTKGLDLGTLFNTGYADNWMIGASIAAGTHTVKVIATSDEGATATYVETVTVGGAVNKQAEFDATEKTKDVGADGATYTLTLENKGDTIATYKLGVEGAEWASVSLDNEIVIEAGATKTIEVTVTPKAGETGSKQFTVYAKADGETADEITLNANLTGENVQEQVIQVLQWVFAVIIIIAIILVIVWAVTKGRKGDEEGAYY